MGQDWKKPAIADIKVHNVCAEYEALVSRASSKVDVLSLYKRGIDWCLENNSPSVTLLRKFKDDCEVNGIYIDREFHGETLNDSLVYVFHNCSGNIRVGLNARKRIIPMLYFANGCDMVVEGSSPVAVRVPIYIFGKNNIKAEETEAFEPVIYRK